MGRDASNFSGILLNIFICMMVSWVDTDVKIHQAEQLRFTHHVCYTTILKNVTLKEKLAKKTEK